MQRPKGTVTSRHLLSLPQVITPQETSYTYLLCPGSFKRDARVGTSTSQEDVVVVRRPKHPQSSVLTVRVGYRVPGSGRRTHECPLPSVLSCKTRVEVTLEGPPLKRSEGYMKFMGLREFRGRRFLSTSSKTKDFDWGRTKPLLNGSTVSFNNGVEFKLCPED